MTRRARPGRPITEDQKRVTSKETLIREILEEAVDQDRIDDADDLLGQIMQVVDDRNLVVRENNKQGIPIVSMIRDDLDKAREAWKQETDAAKKSRIRGRMLGLAQALATVQSPYSRIHGSPGDWHRYVLGVMEGQDR